MIYVEFDKYGVLNTIDLNEETIFKGSNRVNKIFVYFDGIELKPTHYLTYSALVNENDYDGDLTDLASVRTTYNGKDGYTFYLFSNLTAQAGTLKLSVRLVNRETEEILVSGILPLIVQDTAVSTYSNVNITTTQYNGLLVAIDEVAQTLNEINIEEINGLKDKVDEIETSVRMLETTNTNLANTVENLQEENRNQNDLIKKQEKRIHTLELASEGNIIETIEEEATAYEYQLTANTLPYATIEKLGGMTYKSDNILIYDDIPETTINGLNYKAENGVIYLNGTLTTRSSIQINLKKPIGSGTYSYKNLGNGISDSDSRLIMYKLKNDGSTAFVDDLVNGKTETLNLSQESDVIKFGIDPKTYTNATIKPMVVNGTTIPTTYKKGFEGLRNSAVNEVVVKGANLQKTNWSGINSTIELSETLKAGEKYTICVYVNKDKVDCGINILEHNNGANNLLFNNSYTNWAQPQTGWVSFVITPIVDTNYLRINAYGITDQELQGAVLKGALVEENKWVKANLYKPYKEPTSYTIPTSITSIDGYGIGMDETYYNYVDYENKKFIKNVGVYTFNGSESLEQIATNTSGVYRYRWNGVKNFIAKPNTSSVAMPVILEGELPYKSVDANYLAYEGVAIHPNGDLYIFKQDIQTITDMKTYLTGKTLIYPLATPTETDLSYRITDDFIIEVEGGGTLVFENEHENAIPFAWTYQEKL